jgi:molybdenum cofactor cytidylyltransferase
VLDNPQPELGPGASLAVALAEAHHAALLVCLADMPFVTASHLLRLVEAYNVSLEAIASISDGYRGPPAVFPRHLLETGDLARRGARSLLTHAAAVTAPLSMFQDIDTPQDLAQLSIGSTNLPNER